MDLLVKYFASSQIKSLNCFLNLFIIKRGNAKQNAQCSRYCSYNRTESADFFHFSTHSRNWISVMDLFFFTSAHTESKKIKSEKLQKKGNHCKHFKRIQNVTAITKQSFVVRHFALHICILLCAPPTFFAQLSSLFLYEFVFLLCRCAIFIA